MALPQQKKREIVLQLLFCKDFGDSNPQELCSFIMGEFSVSRKSATELIDRVSEIKEKADEIDALVRVSSEEYAFDRIKVVERNILRLSLFEILHDETIPPKVAIAEGIRLSRKFSTPEAGNFVNALLDKIYKEEVDSQSQLQQTK